MIPKLVEDAVRIKLAAKEESPLISAYEFCYAAGLACQVLRLSREEAEQLAAPGDFAVWKANVQERVRAGREAFRAREHGDRLYRLVSGCRHRGQMTEAARQLFWAGYGCQN